MYWWSCFCKYQLVNLFEPVIGRSWASVAPQARWRHCQQYQWQDNCKHIESSVMPYNNNSICVSWFLFIQTIFRLQYSSKTQSLIFWYCMSEYIFQFMIHLFVLSRKLTQASCAQLINRKDGGFDWITSKFGTIL